MATPNDVSGNVHFVDTRNINASLAALNAETVIDCYGRAGASVYVAAGIGSMTLAFEGSIDGTNYFAITGKTPDTWSLDNQTTAAGRWFFDVSSLAKFRVRASTYASGTATVSVIGSQVAQGFIVDYYGSLPLVSSHQVGASGAAVTFTATAVAAKFHYITNTYIAKYAVAALTGSGTPYSVTSTNLNSWGATWSTAESIGKLEDMDSDIDPTRKSAVINTNTTIVCPATTNVIWRLQVMYYSAP